MADREVLSIGEVISLLRDDFPDVSVSKLRFLESQGLIDPKRSPSGYRLFDNEDVARLQFILKQQRDNFLPLKVIKSKLTMWERGEEDGMTAALSDVTSEKHPVDRADLLKRSGLTDEQLDQLEDVGLIAPAPGTDVYPHESRIVASEAARLMERGLEPRHLRTIRLSVEREADLIGQLAAPLLKAMNPDARTTAREILESCSDSIQAMHRALLGVELRRQLHT
ncbi:MAG: MerR family transcriptional regulator [Acidimicrobiia bacterium]|nr:MerR family transcriptional regulator [Acidimicrobiia bacterium]